MRKLKLSIVIRCGDNPEIFRCLESIDYKVEVIVVLNADKELGNKLKKSYRQLKVLYAPKGKIAVSNNIGIECAKNNKVIIMDSDSIFGKNAILYLYKSLDKYLITTSKVIFNSRDNVFGSDLIALMRSYFYSKGNAYSPGLAFNKNELKKQLGYYFDERVHLWEDSDFSKRLDVNEIICHQIKKAKIIHKEVSLYEDLRKAYLYGCGKKQSRVGNVKFTLLGSIVKELSTFRRYKKINIIETIYLIVWRSIFYLGYTLN